MYLLYALYNFLLFLYILLHFPKAAKRWLFEKGYRARVTGSSGKMPETVRKQIANKNSIWVHAASVGEVVAAEPIIRELRQEFPKATIALSVVTATGYEMAERAEHKADAIFYFPLDLAGATKKIVEAVSPSIILVIETEIWPNLIRWAKEREIPMMMGNGRISDTSIPKYRKIRFFLKPVLSHFSRFCMQSDVDARYIAEMGAEQDKIYVLGNTKYDQEYPSVSQEELSLLRKEYHISEKAYVFVAGSTHEGEEETVLLAFQEVRKSHPNAVLILAPRKITRGQTLKALAESMGYHAQLRTDLANAPLDVLILNTIGELTKVYALSDLVFVGGSLVDIGGHNLLEPAGYAKPIITGPYLYNFREVRYLLERNKGCIVAENADGIRDAVQTLSQDIDLAAQYGQTAYAIYKKNQGAARANAQMIREILEETGRLSLVE